MRAGPLERLVELALGALANRHAARLTPIVCRSV